jgi:murein DD-endopeptidase MepM/ murein hydrolase activator NlpD
VHIGEATRQRLAVEAERAPERLRQRSVALPYEQQTRLSLPCAGTWIVANGGRGPATNVHPFAYDFVRPHRGLGEALEDYEAYGAQVLAPADGIVAEVVDGYPDAPPDPDNMGMPNLVVLDHGNGEWSFLAHFRPASIRVRPGERVARGVVMGQCGNSGDSSEPHIHYHLQASAALATMDRDMLPAAFTDILVDGQAVESAEPVRGHRVETRAVE